MKTDNIPEKDLENGALPEQEGETIGAAETAEPQSPAAGPEGAATDAGREAKDAEAAPKHKQSKEERRAAIEAQREKQKQEDDAMFSRVMKKIIIYAVILALFIVYLFNANRILFAFTKGDTDLSKVGHSVEEYAAGTPAYAGIEDVTYLGGLKRDVRFYGWAYAENGERIGPETKTTRLVLRGPYDGTSSASSQREASGPSGVWSAPAVVSIRPDIFYAESEEHVVPNSSVGFEAIFSTLPLKGGVYDVFLYTEETNGVQGLADPDFRVVVSGSETYDAESAPIEDFGDTTPSDMIQLGIDEMHPSESDPTLFTLKGWGLDLNGQPADSKAYVQIKSASGKTAVYPVTLTDVRPDLADSFLISPDAVSGFSKKVKLPTNFGDPAEVSMIFERDGQMLISDTPYTCSAHVGAAVERLGEVPPVENIEGAEPADYVLLGVDTLSISAEDDKLYNMTGWGLRLGERPEGMKAYFQVTAPNGNKATYPLTFTGERPDLMAAFEGVEEGLLTGFNQDFRLPAELDGITGIALVFEDNGKYLISAAPYEAEDEIPALGSEDAGETPAGGEDEATAVPVDSAKIGVDSLTEKDGTLHIEGWGIALDGIPPADAAYLEVTNGENGTARQAITFAGERADIAAAYGIDPATPVAFELDLELPEGFGQAARVDIIFDCGGEFYRANEPFVVS